MPKIAEEICISWLKPKSTKEFLLCIRQISCDSTRNKNSDKKYVQTSCNDAQKNASDKMTGKPKNTKRCPKMIGSSDTQKKFFRYDDEQLRYKLDDLCKSEREQERSEALDFGLFLRLFLTEVFKLLNVSDGDLNLQTSDYSRQRSSDF